MDQFIQQDFTRDRWGRPLIVPAGGGKPQPYTRISGYGSVLENQFGLTKWKLRTLLKGSLDRPDLRASAESRLSDDRYLDEVVEMMMEHAGASSAANIGTAIHEMLAQLDAGLVTVETMPAQFQPFARGWQTALEAHGYTVDPQLIERHLVNDRFQAAGSGDNFVRRISDGKLVALDKKTGKAITKRPLAYMVQLYLYATADLYDVTTGERTPIDNVDTDEALIAHLPAAGDGTCTFYRVDLTGIREVAVLAQAVKRVEKTAPEVVALEATPTPVDPIDLPASAERVEWVKERLRICLGHNEAASQLTRNLWPDSIPGFKGTHRHTHAELNRIVVALERVEAEHHIPFGPNDPDWVVTEQHAVKLVKEAFPTATVSDDSEILPKPLVAEFKELVDGQPPEVKAVMKRITAEASAAKASMSLTQRPSAKRYGAARALLACCQFEEYQAVSAIVTHALGPQKGTLGKIFGNLSITDAEAVENTANAIGVGTLGVNFADDGTMTIAPSNNQ